MNRRGGWWDQVRSEETSGEREDERDGFSRAANSDVLKEEKPLGLRL